MSFYNDLQLDPSILKNKMRCTDIKKEKHYYRCVIFIRSLLIVLFAILFISTLNKFFGQENSAMSVVIFCLLLGVRFVDFGYKIEHSLISLAISFAILLISPIAMQLVNPILGFVINFFSIFTILLLTCDKPEMGNAGLFMFGYVFLTGSMVSYEVFIDRIYLTILGFIICGTILYTKHSDKNKQVHVLDVIKNFHVKTSKGQWQLQIALGVSLLFLLGAFIDIDRFMWVGFAGASMLTSYPINIHDKFKDRILGAVIGSLLFWAVCMVIPENMISILGPVSGLCMGLCTKYRNKTIANCFGALSVATVIYGVKESVYMRIFNNFIGIVFGYMFFHFFQYVIVKYLFEKKSLIKWE